MPKFQLIYIISHETGNFTCTHKKIKKDIEIHEGYTQVYILNIFYTKHIIYMIKKWQMKSKHNN